MTEKEFVRYNWNEYKEMLERYEYTPEQIQAVFDVRENPEIEQMTKEQFDFLVLSGILKRKAKLKKLRSLYVVGDNIVFLSHYHKGWQNVGYFINEEADE